MLPEINSIEGSEGKTVEITQRVEQKEKVQLEEKTAHQNVRGTKGKSTSIWKEKKQALYKVQKSEQFFTSSYNRKQLSYGFKTLKKKNDLQSRILDPNYQTSMKTK